MAIVEEHEIPPYLIMNLDQISKKYLSVSHHTMAQKEAKSVSGGNTYKRCMTMITGTFVITLKGDFLPLQVIYGDKITDVYLDLNLLDLSH